MPPSDNTSPDDSPLDAPEPTQNELLTVLLTKLTEAQVSNALTPSQLESILTRAGVSSATAMHAALKPENTEHEHISAFFTALDRAKYGSWREKPELTRKTYFCGIEEKSDRLTPAEIEAYNAIRTSRTARHGTWTATVKRAGDVEEVWIEVPCQSIDARMNLAPSLLLTLLELNGGPSTTDLHHILRQLDYLKARELGRGVSAETLEQELLKR